jgi:hypothetical protein
MSINERQQRPVPPIASGGVADSGPPPAPVQLVTLCGRSRHQEEWANRNRTRFVAYTQARYGEGIHATLIAACNRYHQVYHWIDYENQTQKEILATLAKQAEAERP